MKKLAIILLAAGNSSRLGQSKQLVPFIDGSLLRWQCLQALSVTEEVTCVIGYEASLMAKEINTLGINQVYNSVWQKGLSSSIACGIASLDNTIDGALLLLIDQWQVTADDLRYFVSEWQKDTRAIVVAINAVSNDKITGPPVIFPRKYFQALINNSGSNGAKTLLKTYKDQVKELTLTHAFVDLDTAEHLLAMQIHLGQIKPQSK